MAGKNNLKPLTTEKAREIGRKGGIASGKRKREVKTFKRALKELLQEEVIDKKGNSTGKTYQDLVNIGLIKGAMKGNAINYKTILETIGETEAENSTTMPTIKLEVVDNSNLEKILYEEK